MQNRIDTLRYVADSVLIEDYASDLVFRKKAGLFQDLGFTGVASSIVSHVKSMFVEDDSPMGWLKAIGNMLLSGALFKLHPLLGLTYSVANALGIDLIGIGKKVLSGLAGAVKGGAEVVMSHVDYHGKIAMIMCNVGLFKLAQKIDIPFLPRKGGSKLENVFGNMLSIGKRGKLKTLLVAIVIWTLKTALLGAGLIGGTSLLTNFIKGKIKPSEKSEEKHIDNEPAKSETIEELVQEKKEIKPLSSGTGTAEFKNDENFVWIIPLIGDVKNTLSLWAEDIYPELSGYKNIMYEVDSFNDVAGELEKRYEPGMSNSLVMPKKYTSRKQVVDEFVDDVFNKLKSIESLSLNGKG